ncbi:oxytocin-neurophysin 1-like [Tupaia chinensis]|uniref:oxytocin-neurophysin 1-like n=1 Tax=Tupaia chinensis TaxID=246437 RepID=UPI0007042B1D|nr:oxytocin-neurophysin 1-like [Tupaia chinensis]
MAISSLACCLLALLGLTSACYVQDCSPDGKRDWMDSEMRECSSCGPDGLGRCFGTNICCDMYTCYLGGAHTENCEEENSLEFPCQPSKKLCGDKGFCSPAGLCCSTDDCIIDPTCD